MENLVAMFQDGGFFMWPILLCLVFAAAISLDRIFYLYVRASLDTQHFLAEVHKLVLAEGMGRALRLCTAEPDALVPRVVKAGLLAATEEDAVVQAALDEAVLDVAPRVTRRIAYLGMLANVATLLGLLGTIQGLIQAFDAVSGASAEAKAELLAQGIAVAMYTTFFGLVVAIPTLVLQAFVQARANALLDDLEGASVKIANLLSARRRRRAADAVSATVDGGPTP